VALVALVGGPAGAGKTTLAAAWCAERELAVHVELDDVRALIVAGRADPQRPELPRQEEQYALAARSCCAVARVFAGAGYDVAIGDVFEPAAFERYWRPELEGLSWRLVVVLPSLEETLARSAGRQKHVRERHSRAQHAACSRWPEEVRVDTSGLGVGESLAAVSTRLEGA
jgi:chloramphenicol 3-O-phosphotransferase